ncbi:MAG: HK97 family phage prohead protease [Gemmatimonadota bacterium]|nr:HK97 family phage prohead protease [Gemmatimonadota bacterium]
MTKIERRSTDQAELRVAGRRIEGLALPFAEVCTATRCGRPERFEPGAFGLGEARTRWLDVGHDRTRVIAYSPGGGLDLRETERGLELSTDPLPELPLVDRTLDEIRRGTLRGLSVEFHAREERTDGNVRVLEHVDLSGVGIVRTPAYTGTSVETRETRQAGTLRGSIPFGSRLECECQTGACQTVEFDATAFDEALQADRLIAVFKDYGGPLAATSRGTMRIRKTDAGLDVEIDLPDTTVGRDVAELAGSVPVIVRPLIDEAASEFDQITDGDELINVYSSAATRAILVGTTDQREGWPEAEIAAEDRAVDQDEARRLMLLGML